MNKTKQDYLLKTLGIQFAVCAVLFLAIFALQKSDSSLYSAIKDAFSGELEKNVSTSEIYDAFSEIKDFAAKESTDESNPDTSFEAPSKQSEETASDTSDTSAAPESTEPQSVAASITAEGGENYSVDENGELPSNVSLSKYTLNKAMTLPVKGTVTSEFGFRIHPITDEYGFHSGIDIAAAEGDNIYAAFDGKVIEASNNDWNGNYLKIEHSNNITTVYCHCSKLNVKAGDNIRAGETVAKVGTTGSSTGPHLHFEIRINNISYDPSYALNEAVNAL